MTAKAISRRKFLMLGGTVAAGAMTGVGAAESPLLGLQRFHVIYRLSLRGRRGSRAAKIHDANLRFATREAADRHRAHVGDNSRIVSVTVSFEEFRRLFLSRHSLVADLRMV